MGNLVPTQLRRSLPTERPGIAGQNDRIPPFSLEAGNNDPLRILTGGPQEQLVGFDGNGRLIHQGQDHPPDIFGNMVEGGIERGDLPPLRFVLPGDPGIRVHPVDASFFLNQASGDFPGHTLFQTVFVKVGFLYTGQIPHPYITILPTQAFGPYYPEMPNGINSIILILWNKLIVSFFIKSVKISNISEKPRVDILIV
jgi:hypothetical protein